MITIEQCRAARGLLGWTQQDLADACGLSKTAINNFEKGHSDIKAESLRAIRTAFEAGNVEFMGDNGLRKRRDQVDILYGDGAIERLFDDIIQTVSEEQSEVLIVRGQRPLNDNAPSQRLQNQMELLREQGVRERTLCGEDLQPFWGNEEFQRWMPGAARQASMTTFLYGQKVALQLWGGETIIVLDSPAASTAERQRFEHLWSRAIERSAAQDQKEKNSSF